VYPFIPNDIRVISVILLCVEHIDMQLCFVALFLPHFISTHSNL